MKFLPLFLFIFCSHSIAQQSAGDELESLLAGLDKFSANFEQRVTESDGYLLDEQQGVLSFERPALIFWEVEEPFPSTLVSDGEQVFLYDPDLNQVTIREWSANPSENPVAVFVGEQSIQDYYLVTKRADEFLLQPLEQNTGYQELRLTFKSDKPETMQLLDSLGQLTQISFSKVNKADIPKSPYEFDIPVDAEIIRDN